MASDLSMEHVKPSEVLSDIVMTDDDLPDPQLICKYCSETCDAYENPSLQCSGKCARKIHVRCLKRGGVPGSLAGDVFFTVLCAECNASQEETITRNRLSWLMMIILALYNLRERLNTVSKRGYFHWKYHISAFIEHNWDYMMQTKAMRKKNWSGTISGTLSHYSVNFFIYGGAELGENGWWKLVDATPPEVLVEKNKHLISDHQKAKADKRTHGSPRSQSSLSDPGSDNANIVSMTPSEFSREHVQPPEFVSSSFITDDNVADVDSATINLTDISSSESMSLADFIKNFHQWQIEDAKSSEMCSNANSDSLSRPVNPAQDPQQRETLLDEVSANPQAPEETSLPSYAPITLCSQTTLQMYPANSRPRRKLQSLLTYHEINHVLNNVTSEMLEIAPVAFCRTYRKLHMWKLMMDLKLSLPSIDTSIPVHIEIAKTSRRNHPMDHYLSENLGPISEIWLQGVAELVLIVSPYTNRILKPFIRRQRNGERPLWLRVMAELRARTSKIPDAPKVVDPASIDYCYVRPHHIAAMNSLCDRFFWSGIDLSECLQYPDFTCVALWKKLVIGFAVMVPDVGFHESYISFIFTRPEWRRVGIGTFMLYHLIKTSPGKDITLHVSSSNRALMLYEKFCFRKEAFILHFYEKHMARGPGESHHALFMRLSSLFRI